MSFSIKYSLLVIFMYCCAWSSYGQKYPSKNISTIDGLPNNQVEAIYKDSRGLLWVGTQNGLAKIDNNGITNFYSEDGLSNNAVWDIKEDASGTLWFGTYGGGVTKFDGKHFTSITQNENLKTSRVRKLYIYNGLLLIGTEKGLFILDLKTEAVTELETHHDRFQIMGFIQYKDELFLATYQSGSYKLNREANELLKVREVDLERSHIFSLFLNGDTLYSANDANGVSVRRKSNIGALDSYTMQEFLTHKPHNKTFGKSIVWDYFKAEDASIYVAAWGVHSNDGGVYKLVNDEFIDMTSNFGIKSHQIRRFFYDTDFKRLYVGTQDQGLYSVDLDASVRFNSADGKVISDFEHIEDDLVLLHSAGLSITSSKGSFDIASKEFYDVVTNFTKKHSQRHFESLSLEGTPENFVFYKLLIKDHSIWITTNYGIFRLTLETKKLNFYPPRPTIIDIDASNNLIVPIPYGEVVKYQDVLTNPIYYIGPKFKNKALFFNKDNKNNPYYITDMAAVNDKLYLSSPVHGLYSYNYTQFKSLYESGAFKEKEIQFISASKALNKLYIATNSGKLFLVNLNDGFKIEQEFDWSAHSGRSILFLESYKDAVLVGTELGLNIITGKRHQFINQEQGLSMIDFKAAKVLEDKLYISTVEGYYTLDMDALTSNFNHNATLALNRINVNQSEYLKKDKTWFTQTAPQFKLPYDQNNLELQFVSYNHPFPKKLEFSYSITGLDTTWNKVVDSKRINLPYLPYGKFEVNVGTKDRNSGLITQSKLASITILPPFWKTWWFNVLMFVITASSLLFVYKKRVSVIQVREAEKAKIQKRLIETKLEALGSQMNPHFAFNALNSIQNYIIDNDVDNALLYLSEFAKLIRKTLDHSSLQFISLSEEISYLQSYVTLENMRFNNRVMVSFDYSDLDIDEVHLPPMLLQPFIENAFVHAFEKTHPKPELSISFFRKDSVLKCIIKDNGKGMGTTLSGQLHQSKGLKLLRERLSLLGTSANNFFTIASEKGKGTTIALNLDIAEFDD
jgi:two-component sensor histidine kinase